MLWEIGPDGCEVRALRGRLGLDSGHASRLLRALEADGMVTVVRAERDRRVRDARLTPAGLAELAAARPPQRRARRVAAGAADAPRSASGWSARCATSSGC